MAFLWRLLLSSQPVTAYFPAVSHPLTLDHRGLYLTGLTPFATCFGCSCIARRAVWFFPYPTLASHGTSLVRDAAGDRGVLSFSSMARIERYDHGGLVP